MTTALSITDLRKTYANGHVALDGIDLTVSEGDFFALLGRNGAGKSTVLGILCSLVNKSSGTVRIFDADIDHHFARAKSYLGVVPQEFNFSIFETPMQILCNQAGYYGIPRAAATERAVHHLRRLGLWDKRDQISQNLSGGMKRRLMVARALMHAPRLLILDEPTAGVDIETRRAMWDFFADINRRGTTIILTTHYLDEAESLCRNIAIIDHGHLLENTTTAELLKKLQRDIYVLDLVSPLAHLPHDHPPGWVLRNPTTLEIDVPRHHHLNRLFAALDHHHLEVRSMRNKTNRLEQLFLDLMREGRAA